MELSNKPKSILKPLHYLLPLGLLISASANAAFIGYQQEFFHSDNAYREYSTKVTLGANYKRHGFYIQPVMAGLPFEDLALKTVDVSYSYHFRLNKDWSVIPGVVNTMTSSAAVYKPQVMAEYRLTDNWFTRLRYRHVFRDNAEPGIKTEQTSQVTAHFGYRDREGLMAHIYGSYYKGHDDQWLYNKTDENWEANLFLGYNLTEWSLRPYVEFSNVLVRTNSDERQLRSRVGVNFFF
ncbi:oligogalacturonate-specific porin KdgM family protein [Vibrio maritimus]|uniref:oligogalacturonate-specific porin KdgM family protein n=1 Tax=Vibrio maritimus TaxID=990268 RepID=UPI0037350374